MIHSIAPPFGHDDATVALRSFPSWNRILGGEAGRWNPRAATIPCPGAPTFLLFCYGVHLVAVLFGPVRAMSTYLEVQGPEGSKLLNLLGDRVSVGKDPSNELAVPSDPSVSRLHAVLERFPAGWCIRDLDSRNGTFVNGARIWGERPLHPGDEIRVGSTTLVFRSESSRPLPSTDAPLPVPGLTRRERDVLVALCRPLASGDVFTEPASVRDMAQALVVSEAAIKQHLAHLYDKFGLYEEDQRRRVRLANEALHRGVVRLGDLRSP